MRNKFKRGDIVVVNGIGKKEDRVYINKRGSIIERDAFFLDYNVKFSKKEDDWFNERALRKVVNLRERNIKVWNYCI